jgi:hypothetical protein
MHTFTSFPQHCAAVPWPHGEVHIERRSRHEPVPSIKARQQPSPPPRTPHPHPKQGLRKLAMCKSPENGGGRHTCSRPGCSGAFAPWDGRRSRDRPAQHQQQLRILVMWCAKVWKMPVGDAHVHIRAAAVPWYHGMVPIGRRSRDRPVPCIKASRRCGSPCLHPSRRTSPQQRLRIPDL